MSPKSWTFEGSNDGTTWNILDTQTNITTSNWTNNPKLSVEIINVLSYKTYRINVTDANDVSFGIGEVEMMGGTELSLSELSELTEYNFINHGMNMITEINYEEITKKMLINSNSSSLNSGKIYEHIVDMSKIKVNKITFL
ncbi:hypothetical protein D3C71_1249550 [compost metagenome]